MSVGAKDKVGEDTRVELRDQSEPPSGRLLTTAEICGYLCINRERLYHLIGCQRFPVYRLGSRSLRFDLGEVAAGAFGQQKALERIAVTN